MSSSRLRTPAGSTFDPQEVARLARSVAPAIRGSRGSRLRQTSGDGRAADAGPVAGVRAATRANDPMFVTELTLIDGGRLFYRGLDAVDLSRSRTFEAVAGWLWTGRWPTDDVAWASPAGGRQGGDSRSCDRSEPRACRWRSSWWRWPRPR